MENVPLPQQSLMDSQVTPECPVFTECGGCQHQDISYEAQLALKEDFCRDLYARELQVEPESFLAIVPSPRPYHYRNRLDLALRRLKSGEILFGFTSPVTRRIIQTDTCAIAEESLTGELARVRAEAVSKFSENKRIANITIKTGEEGQVHWGGIGRHSLRQRPEDYFFTHVRGKKIYYSLDTFFQGNRFILEALDRAIREQAQWNKDSVLFDLFGGCGLFSMLYWDEVAETVLIEVSDTSIKVAEYNKQQAKAETLQLICEQVEKSLPSLLEQKGSSRSHAIIDPPRKGLSPEFCQFLSKQKLASLFYLSCNPETCVRDLKYFLAEGWKIISVRPLDFFPQTRHIEVLNLLEAPQ